MYSCWLPSIGQEGTKMSVNIYVRHKKFTRIYHTCIVCIYITSKIRVV